ncbi:BTNL8 isoform 1 [Pongo abelii]|uniref:BTNL8 isoform 1 n=1 Tax=Pongo abelii TaxID=9601 RepID=A0A2J8SCN3_PONAB|nr:BTNL8 isoform 1 [Pongo abelii]
MAFMLILVLSFYKLASGQWQVTGPGKFVQASVGEDAVFSCSLFPETSAEAMEVRFFRNQLHAVVHLYRDGEDWESKQMPQYRGRTELVKDSIAGGHVSLRLKNITPSDIGLYGCWFSSQIYDEEATWELRVAETFFQPSPWRLASILLGLLCGALCVVVMGMTIVFFKSKGKIQAELAWRRKHGQAELRDARKHAVEVTLDPETAHPQLCVSDLKTVTQRKALQDVPYSEKRFTRKSVVASQGFQAGKHYWEVDVGQNVGWCVGVCRDDVDRRKNNVTLSSHNGYWVLRLNEEHSYFILHPRVINLPPSTPPTRVGIFLDYEGGTISFFNTNDQSLIHTLTCQFEGLLRPYIQHVIYDEKNGTPIFICPVSWGSEREDPA